MPETKRGKRFLITAIDYSTRWHVAWAVTKHTARDVSRFIGFKIISRFGKPKRLITNGGPEMVSHSLNAYCAHNYVERNVTTSYHPQSNGRVERLNGSLVHLLSKMVQDDPKREWDQYLPAVLLALRARINRGTVFSPVTLAFDEAECGSLNSSGEILVALVPAAGCSLTSADSCWLVLLGNKS